MSRFSQLIDNLEDLHQQDIKNSAKVYGITATLASRLEGILDELDNEENSQKTQKNQPLLPNNIKITKAEIIKRYGSYNNAYQAYQKAYGIKCRKGWNHFLEAIQEFPLPNPLNENHSLDLEKRVNKLEKTVKILVKVLLEKI